MLFNSIDFGFFFTVFFMLYWTLRNSLKAQNLFILVFSYAFYAFWDWRFLGLILLSSFIDFTVGAKIQKESNLSTKKKWLIVSILTNLGILGFFKYFNFFTQSFADLFSIFGYEFNAFSLNIILPVGISFYTFQSMSYTIDIYNSKLEPVKDPILFLSYVSFFPQLVAGPIERAASLLPQLSSKRVFDYTLGVEGCRQILWGLFKKVIVADNCALVVDSIFLDPSGRSSVILILGTIFFAFQIYCDFSGYSDIAIGIAKLLGIKLMTNFKVPYFSRDIAEFWRRWHISLSTWFRDYLYIPLGGSQGSQVTVIRNVFIIFIVSGFWHGANWTFLVWGFLNALYFLPLLLTNKNKNHKGLIAENRVLPTIKEFTFMSITFFQTCFAWIFFRATNLSEAFVYIKSIFTNPIISQSDLNVILSSKVAIIGIFILVSIEWIFRNYEFQFDLSHVQSAFLRWPMYVMVIIGMLSFAGNKHSFIYFQF